MKNNDGRAAQLAWSVYFQLKYCKTLSVLQLLAAAEVLEVASELMTDNQYDKDAKAMTLECIAALTKLAEGYGCLDVAQQATTKVWKKQYSKHVKLLYWL